MCVSYKAISPYSSGLLVVEGLVVDRLVLLEVVKVEVVIQLQNLAKTFAS